MGGAGARAICRGFAGDPVASVCVAACQTELRTPPSLDRKKAQQRLPVSVKAFCMAENEVAAGEYHRCVLGGGCAPMRDGQTRFDLPVHSVTYDEVQRYMAWLGTAYGRSYRLPTEVEWQLAAMGDVRTTSGWPVRNFDGLNVFSGYVVAVGRTPKNANGIRDMIGNVSEFVSGCFDFDDRLNREMPAYGDCSYHPTKGGNFKGSEQTTFSLDPYFRMPLPPDFPSPQVGFCVTRSLPEGAACD